MKVKVSIPTCNRSAIYAEIIVRNVQREQIISILLLESLLSDLHVIGQVSFKTASKQIWESAWRWWTPKFCEGDFVLVTRNDFIAREELYLRWRVPRRIEKAVNGFELQFKELRNRPLQNVHSSLLAFYYYVFLDSNAVSPQVTSPETKMIVKWLKRLEDIKESKMFQVRWYGLPNSEYTLEAKCRYMNSFRTIFVRYWTSAILNVFYNHG